MAACNCIEADLKFDNLDWINLVTKVSVIIPTYNRAHFLGEAIQSVLDQTFSDFELIIVDDGSTDNTEEVVRSFRDPRIRYLNQENSGVSAARNTGIKNSDGEYIAFLDSDDIWLPQNLDVKVRLLDAHPNVGLVCSDAYMFNNLNSAKISKRWHDRYYRERVNLKRAARQPLKEMLTRGCFILPQASVVRHTVFDLAGYFDESLRTHEDWDLFVRIIKLFPIEVIDTPLLKKRSHGNSLSSDWDRMYLGAVTVLNKALTRYSLNEAELKLIKRRLARVHFAYGEALVLNNKIKQGREKLLASIKINPWFARAYFWLAGSFLGDFTIQAIKSLVKPFKRRVTMTDPSAD